MCRSSFVMVALAMLVSLGCGLSVDDHLDAVRELGEEGDYAETLPLLSDLLDEDPRNPELNYLYGVALVATGNSGMAIWPLRTATEDPDYTLRAGTLLASALAKGAVPMDAVTFSDRILALYPSNAEALAIRAKANLALLDYDSLLSDSERLLEVAPQHGWATVWKIQALIALDRLDEAESELQAVNTNLAYSRGSFGILPRLCVHEAKLSEAREDEDGEISVWVRCARSYSNNPDLVLAAVSHLADIGADEEVIEALEGALQVRPEALRVRFELADALARKGMVAEAEAALMEGVRILPEVPQARLALADHYRQREEYERAVEVQEPLVRPGAELDTLMGAQYADDLIQLERWDEFEEVIARLNVPSVLLLLNGRALLAQGEPERALFQLRSGLELWPSNVTANFLAGTAAEELGLFEEAVEYYRGSLRADPQATDAAFRLFAIHVARGEWGHAFTVLMHRIKADPTELRPHLLRFDLLKRLGRTEMLAQALEALAAVPEHHPEYVSERAKFISVGTEGPAEAIQYIRDEDLDLLDSANVPVLDTLVDLLLQSGGESEARELVLLALEEEGDSARLYGLKARVLLSGGADTKEAEKLLERAIELDAGFVEGYEALAEIALGQGDREKASDLFATAMRLDLEGTDYGWRVFDLNPDWDGAQKESHALSQLKRNPLDSRACLEMARLEFESGGGMDAAEPWLTRSLKLGAGEAGWVTQGSLYLAADMPEEAARSFRRALAIERGSSRGVLGLAQASLARGNVDEARAILQRALSNPNFNQVEFANDLLDEISGGQDDG